MDVVDVINCIAIFFENHNSKGFSISTFKEYLSKRLDGIECFNGATRVCVTCADWDFVFKFDHWGEDYCELEYHNYQRAIDYNIERILLPIEPFTVLNNGLVIYKQAKYSFPVRDLWLHPAEMEQVEHTEKYTNLTLVNTVLGCCYDDNIPIPWISRVIQLYGKRFIRSFVQWTQECEVNDLHAGNVGYYNGKPIIIDYAGYF